MKDSQNEEVKTNDDFAWLYEQAVVLIEKEELILPEDLKGPFLRFHDLSSAKQLHLIKRLSKIEGLPKIMLNFINNVPYFTMLPDETLLKDIAGYVKNEPISSSAFVLTSKREHGLFQPDRIFAKFFEYIAYGKQGRAEEAFNKIVKKEKIKQELLLRKGIVTDCSGRTFKDISAYEYAYWAKDTHMCRMLEKYMDADTKAQMLKRCEEMEENGLTYTQNGVENKGSKHFDFTPLITALNSYIQGYDNWMDTGNGDAITAAWLAVGRAQRNVPVHVINEYCHPSRSFKSVPAFNEENLPRVVTYYNYKKKAIDTLYPLVVSDVSGLGVDFSLARGMGLLAAILADGAVAALDLAAIRSLDEVRTTELKQSRKNLEPPKTQYLTNKTS